MLDHGPPQVGNELEEVEFIVQCIQFWFQLRALCMWSLMATKSPSLAGGVDTKAISGMSIITVCSYTYWELHSSHRSFTPRSKHTVTRVTWVQRIKSTNAADAYRSSSKIIFYKIKIYYKISSIKKNVKRNYAICFKSINIYLLTYHSDILIYKL